MPEEVRAEIGPYFMERSAILEEDSAKLPKLGQKRDTNDAARYVQKGLTVRQFRSFTFSPIFS